MAQQIGLRLHNGVRCMRCPRAALHNSWFPNRASSKLQAHPLKAAVRTSLTPTLKNTRSYAHACPERAALAPTCAVTYISYPTSHISHLTSRISHPISRISRFTFHITSHLTSHISHLISHISYLISHLTSCILHHISHISYLTSHLTSHISHAISHLTRALAASLTLLLHTAHGVSIGAAGGVPATATIRHGQRRNWRLHHPGCSGIEGVRLTVVLAGGGSSLRSSSSSIVIIKIDWEASV